MTFLDTAPLDYSLPEATELRDLFVLSYRREAAAEQLADSAGLVPGMFPLHDNMRLIWTDLLTVMSNQGKLRVLVEKAIEDPTAGAYQQRFQEMLSANPSVRPPEPAQPAGWWKGDDQHPAIASKLYYERLIEKRSRLLHVDVARRITEMAHSVAKLTMQFAGGERAHGTAFLIQPDLLLTNHHNLVEPKYGPLLNAAADFDDERGFAGDHLVVAAKVDTFVGDAQHDWAAIQLENKVDPEDRPPIKLGSPFSVDLNDTLIIIQHPLGGMKQFALDAMAVRHVDDDVVQYVADTQKGSSGSPVFSSQMHVVALHHAEAEISIDVDGRQEVVWRNEGIHINQVTKALEEANIDYSSN